MSVSDDAGRRPFTFEHSHDASEWCPGRRLLESRPYFIDAGRAFRDHGDFNDASGARGYAIGFARYFEVFPDEEQRLRRTRGRWDDVLGGRPRVTPVLHRLIGQGLAVR